MCKFAFAIPFLLVSTCNTRRTRVIIDSESSKGQLASLLLAAAPALAHRTKPIAVRSKVLMQGPRVVYNANEDYDPDTGKPLKAQGKGKSTMAQDFQSTDTPDFLPEEGSEAADKYNAIDFKDGMGGSAGMGNKKSGGNPGVEGALDVNPEIFVPEAATYEGVEFVLPSSGMVDREIDMFVDGGGTKSLDIDIMPTLSTFEDYVVGFTADSHPSFKLASEPTGRMNRRGEAPAVVTVECAAAGQGALVGYLCFIYPEEKMFSQYFKITCESRVR